MQQAKPQHSTDPVADNQAELGELESLLKASADQLRLRILQMLKHDAFGVMELCALLDIKQSAMSHHLKVLTNAGMVSSRREGNTLFYRRAIPGTSGVSSLMAGLFNILDQQLLPDQLQSSLDKTQHLRAQRSLEFFSANADRFQAQQELISHIDDYRDAVNEIIDSYASKRRKVLEVGPGEGDYLPDLSTRFEQVVALDNAETMLQKSRQKASDRQLGNIDFYSGDTRQFLATATGLFDCAIANMVLHHNARPAALFADAAKLLCTGGIFIVTELCEHEQNWVREAAGDVWLGFYPGQLDRWAAEAGLEQGPGSYTALRNGFRIQVRSYLKPLPENTAQQAN